MNTLYINYYFNSRSDYITKFFFGGHHLVSHCHEHMLIVKTNNHTAVSHGLTNVTNSAVFDVNIFWWAQVFSRGPEKQLAASVLLRFPIKNMLIFIKIN